MRPLGGIAVTALMFLACGGLLSVSAQQRVAPDLPRVSSAWAPSYPPLARQAGIQGLVSLRVTTDGKHVATFDSESGPALLVIQAKENVKTWEFSQHQPITFEIRFNYKLFTPCEPLCECSGDKQESVVLRLPTDVELNAPAVIICDPSESIEKKK